MFRDWLAAFDSGRQKLACAVWVGVGVGGVSSLCFCNAICCERMLRKPALQRSNCVTFLVIETRYPTKNNRRLGYRCLPHLSG